MGKLEINVDWDKLTPKEKTEFLRLIDKSNAENKPFNPFERVEKDKLYHYIVDGGAIESEYDDRGFFDNKIFKDLNYFNDAEFAKNQALRELLNRKLIKFSYENNGADIDPKNKYRLYIDCQNQVDWCCASTPDIFTPLFISAGVAQRAIDEIIKPFIKEHPDFKFWG